MRFSDELVGANAPPENRRIILLALTAVPLSLATTLLPHDEPIKWAWIWAAIGVSLLVGVSIALSDAAARRGSPVPPWITLFDLMGMIVACGLAVYGASGSRGIYNPLLLIVLALFAMWGDSRMLVLGTILTGTALGLATLASGADPGVTVTIVAEYSICFGITATIMYLLVNHIRDERENSRRLAASAKALGVLAQTAATFTELEPAMRTCLPMMTTMLAGASVELFALGATDGSEPRVIATSNDLPTEVAATVAAVDRDLPATQGIEPHIDGSRAYVRLGRLENQTIMLVIDVGTELDDQLAGTVASIGAVLANVVDRASFVVELERLTVTDALTGVSNRLALNRHLDYLWSLSARTKLPLSIAMIDIDHFKKFNDAFGHLAGDSVLKGVASVIHERIRRTDMVARYGGEEFCVCLPDTPISGAAIVVNDALESVHRIDAGSRVSFSAGIATWDGNETAEQLLKRADAALYVAKSAGRDRVHLDTGVGSVPPI